MMRQQESSLASLLRCEDAKRNVSRSEGQGRGAPSGVLVHRCAAAFATAAAACPPTALCCDTRSLLRCLLSDLACGGRFA